MSLKDILDLSFEFSSKIGTRQLPKLSETYESNVKGLYIVGDLADAPVIKIALVQGFDVANKVVDRDFGGSAPTGGDFDCDVVVLGAGPAGIGAALALSRRGVRYQLIERERPFNTIQNFPKHKHIFSEPRDFGNVERFPFMDAIKEDLIEVWEKAIDDNELIIHQPEEVVDITRVDGGFQVTMSAMEGAEWDGKPVEKGTKRTLKVRRVILAIGRRGTVRKLGVPGQDLDKVEYGLHDPEAHKGEKVLVVGGGDSAVEAAVALAHAGADVSISYRQDAFIRAKLLNQQRINEAISDRKIRAFFKTTPKEVTEDKVILNGPDGDPLEVENDRVFGMIGTKLPLPFLQKIGVRMEGALSPQRLTFIISFALISYMFYCIKSHKLMFPFGEGHPLHFVHEAVKLNLGWRWVDGSFWGTVIYSLMITVFGVQAMRKYKSKIQTQRYISLIVFQLLFLFGIPELIAPFIIDQPWKVYSVTVPWPLSIWSLIHAETAWLIAGAATAFVAMPLFVRFHGERFCSWACGCGGLAETLGDRWRHLAPRGSTSKRAEILGRIILGFAAVTTLIILGHDVWGFLQGEAWTNAKSFVQHWYGLIVDFWFASVVGVAFYPYLGNRVWCRFLCPLRAYMELLARWWSRIKIVANDRCIGCGECTRFCQMGIPVQKFAQMRADLANHNSACIQCGICVEVCPMEVLSVTRDEGAVRVAAKKKGALPIVS